MSARKRLRAFSLDDVTTLDGFGCRLRSYALLRLAVGDEPSSMGPSGSRAC
jgi:hypothetical protein